MIEFVIYQIEQHIDKQQIMFKFLKKVKLNHKMEQFVDEISNMNWFSNVGNVFISDTNYYNTISVERKEALKVIHYKPNTNKVICLQNLIGEAMRRSLSYLYNNRKDDHKHTWNKLAKKNREIIDFSKINNIANEFTKDNDLEDDLCLQQVILYHMNELYFQELDINYPTFFMDVFDIYRKGNIMVGWKGKLPPESDFLDTKIHKDNGSVLVW